MNSERTILSLLPGPVRIDPDVQEAFLSFSKCHRSQEFEDVYLLLKKQLCNLTGAEFVEIMMGSGTLANDVVAGQLQQLSGSGLVLSNGEFGERLVDHAVKADLEFNSVCHEWGEPFKFHAIEKQLDRLVKPEWLWMVHCETSTGMLNDLDSIKSFCRTNNLRVCVDCISSIGVIPVDLGDVYLGTGTSSKGLVSFAGLSMVYHNHLPKAPSKAIPKYLDLHGYASLKGVPFTTSSNLLHALYTSLKKLDINNKSKQIEHVSSWLRDALEAMGVRVLISRDTWNPAVMTLDLSEEHNAIEIGDYFREHGILVHYESSYLKERNWLQLSIMSHIEKEELIPALKIFRSIFSKPSVSA